MKLQKSNQISILILLPFLNAFCFYASAQVSYSYDNNGNRTSDIVIVGHAPVHNHHDSTGKDSSNVANIKVYPNPTTAQVNVSISSFKSCGSANIYLSDASGNLLSTQKATSTLSIINLASNEQGTYYIRIIMCDDEYSYTVIKNSPGAGTPATTSKPPLIK
jgi:hypothetical protein